jgi:hypothetical protein
MSASTMADPCQERLKSHARSFDSLLSIIPANLYYGGDVSVRMALSCLILSGHLYSLQCAGSMAKEKADP